MTERNWEFEIAVLLFIGFLITALLVIGSEYHTVHAVLHGPHLA